MWEMKVKKWKKINVHFEGKKSYASLAMLILKLLTVINVLICIFFQLHFVNFSTLPDPYWWISPEIFCLNTALLEIT